MPLKKWKLQDFLRLNLIQNILALYGVHFFRYLIPLILIPYLTRTLGLKTWGIVSFCQSFAFFMVFFVEYGFIFSASRKISQHRNNQEILNESFAAVFGAKLVLSSFFISLSWLALPKISFFAESSKLFFYSSILWGSGQAFNLLW
ncbi:MAG: oligosaccharide flippase family protein, partial [Deltaproteobacteria bacterium]|nr:oligosaccharide flippase family protein [Deltaproteobacteria bacterium]